MNCENAGLCYPHNSTSLSGKKVQQEFKREVNQNSLELSGKTSDCRKASRMPSPFLLQKVFFGLQRSWLSFAVGKKGGSLGRQESEWFLGLYSKPIGSAVAVSSLQERVAMEIVDERRRPNLIVVSLL